MSDVIPLPPFPIIQKPREGAACNGCGWCCHTEVCALGQMAFKIKAEQTPCPAMMFTDNKVRCGLVEAEKELAGEPKLAKMLGIDTGCDSTDFRIYGA